MAKRKKRILKAKSARCDIALLVDAEADERKSSGLFVPERSSVEAYLLAELRAQGLTVAVLPFDTSVDATITELRETGYVAEPDPKAIADAYDRSFRDRDAGARMGAAGLELLRETVPTWPEVVTRLLE